MPRTPEPRSVGRCLHLPKASGLDTLLQAQLPPWRLGQPLFWQSAGDTTDCERSEGPESSAWYPALPFSQSLGAHIPGTQRTAQSTCPAVSLRCGFLNSRPVPYLRRSPFDPFPPKSQKVEHPLVPSPLPPTADSRGGEGAARNRNTRRARGFSRVTSGVWGQTRRNQQPQPSDLPDKAGDSPERLRLLRGECPIHIAAFLCGRTCYPKSLLPS